MKVKVLRNRDILSLIAFIILSIIALIFVAFHVLIGSYFSTDIDIEDKSVNIDNTIDVDLPSLDSIDKNNDNQTLNLESTKDNIYTKEQKQDEIINILLCGMDARNYEDNSRSDTIILASYNKTQHSVKLVSFMRDSWIYLPERGWSRINTATVLGGIGLLVNTINYNFNLDIQDYIQIKFDDFKIVIDTLGGIDVELTKQEIQYINNKLHVEDKDYDNDVKSKPGFVHLNGAQALWHCRNRTIGNSDYERTERQREVLSIIIDKLLTLNIGQVTRLVYELRGHVNTNLDLDTIFDIGNDALVHKNIKIESSRIPFDGEYWSANKRGASVLELDIEGNTKLLHEFLGYKIEDNDNINKKLDKYIKDNRGKVEDKKNDMEDKREEREEDSIDNKENTTNDIIEIEDGVKANVKEDMGGNIDDTDDKMDNTEGKEDQGYEMENDISIKANLEIGQPITEDKSKAD